MDPNDYPTGSDERCDVCGALVDACRCVDEEYGR